MYIFSFHHPRKKYIYFWKYCETFFAVGLADVQHAIEYFSVKNIFLPLILHPSNFQIFILHFSFIIRMCVSQNLRIKVLP